MYGKKGASILLLLAMTLGVSASAMGANILFIAALDEGTKPSDDALFAFLEGLGHTVTYFDDDATEAETEAAAAAADLVFISESVGSGKIQNEITEMEVPMVTTEAWAFEEMGLTASGTGEGLEVDTNDIEIVLPEHPLAAGFSGTVSVFTAITGPRNAARLTKGSAGESATVVARATLSDGATYDVIWVYEKGAKLAIPPADGSPQRAADIRVCFGLDEQSYLLWNENAYALFQAAINFGLGIRLQPEAYSPSPGDKEVETPRDATLSWKQGIYADTHNVYFGTDFNDVSEATPDGPRDVLVSLGQKETTWDPGVLLDYNRTYYWRVDEVNAPPDSTVYKGPVWSFTVLNFLVVDDFESYGDEQPNRVFDTWMDGWYNKETNGAEVGYATPNLDAGEHFIETLVSHNGRQSMPFSYDNDKKYSEAQIPLSGLASDWTREDVESLSLWFRGYPPYVGAFVEKAGGVYEVTGAGIDIWDNKDEFHYAYKEVGSGNISIIVKVESLENTQPYAKAGVIIRDSLEPGARNAGLFVTPENGVRFQYRLTDKGATNRQYTEGLTAPYWLKLERTSGGLVRAYHSPDGATWTQYTLQPVSMTWPVYVGLAVTSHVSAVPCTGVFSNVTLTAAGGDQAWADQDIGLTTNSIEPMYVALNGNAVVQNDDPNAVVNSGWTEWRVPLQAFADKGVDLANVTSLAIGVGTQGNTTEEGGSGKLFIDDIRLYRPEP
jgi:hypothetical protein